MLVFQHKHHQKHQQSKEKENNNINHMCRGTAWCQHQVMVDNKPQVLMDNADGHQGDGTGQARWFGQFRQG